MGKLSVVISAYNEEAKIADCLDSVKWADEIIFVDNSSTDSTAKIAAKFTRHIYKQKNDPANIDLQKNFGIEKAAGEWILLLDADERVTPELAGEIKKVIIGSKTPSDSPLSGGESLSFLPDKEAEPQRALRLAQSMSLPNARLLMAEVDRSGSVNGYWIPRKNIIFGKWIEHSGWYPDYQLRLFKKGKGKYALAHYHEPLQVEGETEKLQEHLIHLNYESITQFIQRNLERYAQNEADELLRKGYVFAREDAIRFPVKEFLSRYFAREGYKDGFHGLVLAMLMAASHFAVFCSIWEKKKFIDIDAGVQNFESLQIELQKAEKEFRYWIYNERIDTEKNFIKKALLQVKRKLQV